MSKGKGYDYDRIVSNEDGQEFGVAFKTIEESKVYTWTRLYIRDEVDIKSGEHIRIKHTPTKEYIDLEFSSFEKKGFNRNENGEIIINYESEEDKKILCLLVDMSFINKSDNNIPFLRSIFRGSDYYEEHVIRMMDFKFTHLEKETELDCYSVKF